MNPRLEMTMSIQVELQPRYDEDDKIINKKNHSGLRKQDPMVIFTHPLG